MPRVTYRSSQINELEFCIQVHNQFNIFNIVLNESFQVISHQLV